MKLWIARDKFGGLYLHLEEPQRVEEGGYFRSINAMTLPILEYPEVRWENSPQQVELKLVKSKNKCIKLSELNWSEKRD